MKIDKLNGLIFSIIFHFFLLVFVPLKYYYIRPTITTKSGGKIKIRRIAAPVVVNKVKENPGIDNTSGVKRVKEQIKLQLTDDITLDGVIAKSEIIRKNKNNLGEERILSKKKDYNQSKSNFTTQLKQIGKSNQERINSNLVTSNLVTQLKPIDNIIKNENQISDEMSINQENNVDIDSVEDETNNNESEFNQSLITTYLQNCWNNVFIEKYSIDPDVIVSFDIHLDIDGFITDVNPLPAVNKISNKRKERMYQYATKMAYKTVSVCNKIDGLDKKLYNHWKDIRLNFMIKD